MVSCPIAFEPMEKELTVVRSAGRSKATPHDQGRKGQEEWAGVPVSPSEDLRTSL